jgi:hypothetical protein
MTLSTNDTQHNDIQLNDTQNNDTQHINTQHNDTQHNYTQHNDTQLNDTHSTLSIVMLSDAVCIFMRIFTFKHNVIMSSVI